MPSSSSPQARFGHLTRGRKGREREPPRHLCARECCAHKKIKAERMSAAMLLWSDSTELGFFWRCCFACQRFFTPSIMSRVVRNSFFCTSALMAVYGCQKRRGKKPSFLSLPPFLPQIVLMAGGEGKESALLQFMAEACGGWKEKKGKEWRWKVQT